MEELVNFLRDYWQEIATAIIFILNVLILVLKKNKVSVKLPPNSYEIIIELVNEAETIFGQGHGDQKLRYVLNTFRECVGLCWVDKVSTNFITKLVEDILSTPQKKKGE